MATSDDILRFWSPPGLDAGEETHRHQFSRSSDHAVFHAHAGSRGRQGTRLLAGRPALAARADHHPRSVLPVAPIADTARAYAQDAKDIAVAIEGMTTSTTVGFRQVGENVPASAFRTARDTRKDGCFVRSDDCRSTGETTHGIYMLSAPQARGHREVIARFLLSPPESPSGQTP
jgi:hypothetical protein